MSVLFPRVSVGNDVVDLADPRLAGKVGDSRFVRRVLSDSERMALAHAADTTLELWYLWAAKEAAYKSVSKTRNEPPVFAHAKFVVSWDGPPAQHDAPEAPDSPETPTRTGTVRFEEAEVPIVLHAGSEALHVHGYLWRGAAPPPGLTWTLAPLDARDSPWAGSLPELLGRLSARERQAVHSVPSAAVRLGARSSLAAAMGVDQGRLEVVCDPGPLGRRPPRVFLDGTPAAADISLSHAGRWIAWAHWVPSSV